MPSNMTTSSLTTYQSFQYGWQTLALLSPVFVFIFGIMNSFYNQSIEGALFVVFGIILIACNEALSNSMKSNVLNKGMCGHLNYYKNYFMLNSNIITSFGLAYYGLHMYFRDNLNIAFLVLLSFFVFVDAIYSFLVCSVSFSSFGGALLFGGVGGLVWSSLWNIVETNTDNSAVQGKQKKETKVYVYNNGEQIASAVSK